MASTFSLFVTSIFALKILFIVLAVSYLYTKHRDPKDMDRLTTLQFWKERVEFVFVFCMSLLLLYLFNPRANHLALITKETQWLLYLFGFILIATAQWELFWTQSPWIPMVRSVLT